MAKKISNAVNEMNGETKKKYVIQTMFWLATESYMQPAFLYGEKFIDECLQDGLIDDETAEKLNDDDKKDIVMLAYLFKKGIISIDAVKSVYSGNEFINRSSDDMAEIAKNLLGAKML